MATFFKDDKKVLVRDQNRYRKVYRYIRKKPKPLVCNDDNFSSFTWGAHLAYFNNQSELLHDFACCFKTPPAIIATTVQRDLEASAANNPNFNVFITDITTSTCIFRTSGYYTGYVYYQALEDGAYTMPNIGKELEVKTLQFPQSAGQDYYTYPFTAEFGCNPIVTVSADEDVNAFVTAISTTHVTIEVSKAGYQGKVYMQAIERGC